MQKDNLKDGTLKSGFVKAAGNPPPRQCSNCRWMDDGVCKHPEVKADSEALPKNEEGYTLVDPMDCCDYYQVKPLICFYRHGQTTVNRENKFRGFINVPLDEEGIKEAHDSGELTEYIPFKAFYSSDLKRAVQTADIIIEELEEKPPILENVAAGRPWNVGEFAGMEKTDEAKALIQAYADNPDIPVPGGESLNAFRSRFTSLFNLVLSKAKELGGPVGLVGHASNGHELGAIIYNDIDALDSDPGGIIMIYEVDGVLQGSVVKNKPVGGTGFGAS